MNIPTIKVKPWGSDQGEFVVIKEAQARGQEMSQVHTTKGLIDRDQLTVADIVTNEPNARVIATEWHLGDELVRRDVAVSILCGQALAGEQAEL